MLGQARGEERRGTDNADKFLRCHLAGADSRLWGRAPEFYPRGGGGVGWVLRLGSVDSVGVASVSGST